MSVRTTVLSAQVFKEHMTTLKALRAKHFRGEDLSEEEKRALAHAEEVFRTTITSEELQELRERLFAQCEELRTQLKKHYEANLALLFSLENRWYNASDDHALLAARNDSEEVALGLRDDIETQQHSLTSDLNTLALYFTRDPKEVPWALGGRVYPTRVARDVLVCPWCFTDVPDPPLAAWSEHSYETHSLTCSACTKYYRVEDSWGRCHTIKQA